MNLLLSSLLLSYLPRLRALPIWPESPFHNLAEGAFLWESLGFQCAHKGGHWEQRLDWFYPVSPSFSPRPVTQSCSAAPVNKAAATLSSYRINCGHNKNCRNLKMDRLAQAKNVLQAEKAKGGFLWRQTENTFTYENLIHSEKGKGHYINNVRQEMKNMYF